MWNVLQELWGTILTQGIPPELQGIGYVVLAMMVAVEGPIVTVLMAILAGAGALNPWLVVGSALIGNLTAGMPLGALAILSDSPAISPGCGVFSPKLIKWQERPNNMVSNFY
jgi:hypothetical protein